MKCPIEKTARKSNCKDYFGWFGSGSKPVSIFHHLGYIIHRAESHTVVLKRDFFRRWSVLKGERLVGVRPGQL